MSESAVTYPQRPDCQHGSPERALMELALLVESLERKIERISKENAVLRGQVAELEERLADG